MSEEPLNQQMALSPRTDNAVESNASNHIETAVVEPIEVSRTPTTDDSSSVTNSTEVETSTGSVPEDSTETLQLHPSLAKRSSFALKDLYRMAVKFYKGNRLVLYC
jgi:hypothetical protein